MVDRFSSMAIFAAVVEARSFSGAARDLDVSKSAVSKHVSRLEERLGMRLLNRTTRQLSLTEAGATFYDYCARILEEAEEAEAAVTRLRSEPRGKLRMNVPMSFGILHVAPAIPDFIARYPGITVDMVLDDGFVDLVEEGYDVAIRIGHMADSSLIVRRLARIRLVLCAAPSYLSRRGRPDTPDDLMAHDCLEYRQGAPANWVLDGPEGRYTVKVSGPVCANNGDVLRIMAVAGAGILLSPTFIVGSDISEGRLEVVLGDYVPPVGEINAVYPHRRHLSPKVRAFVDFMVERLGPAPYWDEGLMPR